MLIQIITYILLPIVVAYITTVLAKQREVRLEAQGQLLEHRIQAYADVYRFMRKNLERIAVPLVEEKLYAECLQGSDYKIGHQGFEYTSYLCSIEQIENYSDELKHLLLTNDLYLEPNLRCELYNLQLWVDRLFHLLHAFKATEEDPCWGFDSFLQRDNISCACSLLGIALQNDVNVFTRNIEPLLENKLRHPKLRRWKLNTHKQEGNNHSFAQSQLVKKSPDLIVRLNYLHYSSKYTPNQFDELPEDRQHEHLDAFFKVFRKNLNDGY